MKPVYNSLSPSRKADIWIEKFSTMSKSSKWNQEEVSHFQKMILRINSKYFIDIASGEELRQFAKQWEEEGIEKFKWSKAHTYVMLISFNTFDDISPERLKFIENYNPETLFSRENGNGAVVNERKIPDSESVTVRTNCSCCYDSWCQIMALDSSVHCVEGSCREVGGCGIFGTSECDGICG